jgi:hypothetical protein
MGGHPTAAVFVGSGGREGGGGREEAEGRRRREEGRKGGALMGVPRFGRARAGNGLGEKTEDAGAYLTHPVCAISARGEGTDRRVLFTRQRASSPRSDTWAPRTRKRRGKCKMSTRTRRKLGWAHGSTTKSSRGPCTTLSSSASLSREDTWGCRGFQGQLDADKLSRKDKKIRANVEAKMRRPKTQCRGTGGAGAWTQRTC